MCLVQGCYEIYAFVNERWMDFHVIAHCGQCGEPICGHESWIPGDPNACACARAEKARQDMETYSDGPF